jgi:hypothetical protein
MISQDPSPASTVAPSGGSRGNPYATTAPRGLQTCTSFAVAAWAGRRRGVLVGLLSSQPLAEPGLPARTALPSGAHARELDHQRSARVNRWELVCGYISWIASVGHAYFGLQSVSQVLGV